MDKNVIVVDGLFDTPTYNEIVGLLDNTIPMIPQAWDPDEFVRYYLHNPIGIVDLHKGLTEFASDVFGEKLKPSYSFLSMYKNGGKCPLHIDRPQCYRTIDYLVRSTCDDWPIKIGAYMTDDERAKIVQQEQGHPKTTELMSTIIAETEWEKVSLKPNQAVLYSGTNSWHYRPVALDGEADLIFFHFVKESFDGPLS